MAKKRKGGAQPAQQEGVHPETHGQVSPGVPDENSSKTTSDGEQRDARSGHDKDGNADQQRNKRG